MNAIEALEKIKALFSEGQEPTPAPAPEPAPTVFESYDLLDGSKIELTALEVGASATIKDANGDAIPAPDAQYTMADGTEVSIAGGVITAIEPKEEPNEPTEVEVEMAKFKDQIEGQKVEIEKLQSTIAQFSTAMGSLIEVVETLAQAPSVEPSVTPQSFKHVEPLASKEERLLSKLKNLK